MNTNGSLTKTLILKRRRAQGHNEYWDLNFGRSSSEQLFNIQKDPECVNNLIDYLDFQELKENLSSQLVQELIIEGDPRMFGEGDIFHRYLYSAESQRDY